MTDSKEIAAAWLVGLRARGIAVRLRNNRVEFHPRSAHAQLTDDEVITMRHHRPAIKEVVVAGGWETTAAVAVEPATPVAAPAPNAAELAADRDAALKERDLAAWRIIHWHDADEVERRNREATELMLSRVGKPHPWL